jgi:transcriptional regulator with XRE-family HTH domain
MPPCGVLFISGGRDSKAGSAKALRRGHEIFHQKNTCDRIPPLSANNTIIKMESGENKNPTLETLRKAAKVLDISVDELIN